MSELELAEPPQPRMTAPVHRDPRRRFSPKWIFGALILCVIAYAFLGRGKKAGGPPERAPRPVFVAKVTTQDVPLYLDEIGTTAAYETVDVKPQVTGQIIAREFTDGADVKKGDLLFRIDARPYEAALQSAKADAALAQANLRRMTELQAKNVTATQELDTARANAMRTEA